MKAFEICAVKQCFLQYPQEHCPYEELQGSYEDLCDECTSILAKDALALLKEQQQQIWEFQDQVEYLTDRLKEQEAVEPKKENDGNPEPWTAWWYVCGDCGQPIDRMDRYCRRCGKQVKWE